MGGFNSISEMNMTTATTPHSLSHYEESERKNKAKIELLEKKIRAKDQLFDDALASTVASVCGCGSSAVENKSLTTELKKRFLKLKTRYAEAEQEI
jgi:phosphoheptose isomerase